MIRSSLHSWLSYWGIIVLICAGVAWCGVVWQTREQAVLS